MPAHMETCSSGCQLIWIPCGCLLREFLPRWPSARVDRIWAREFRVPRKNIICYASKGPLACNNPDWNRPTCRCHILPPCVDVSLHGCMLASMPARLVCSQGCLLTWKPARVDACSQGWLLMRTVAYVDVCSGGYLITSALLSWVSSRLNAYTCGCQLMWLSAYVDICLCGYLLMWISAHVNVYSHGYLLMRTAAQMDVDACSCGRLLAGHSYGRLHMWTPAHLDAICTKLWLYAKIRILTRELQISKKRCYPTH